MVSSAVFSVVYLSKLTQNIYDYYFLRSAWRMYKSQLTYFVFNQEFSSYNPRVHVLRGSVEWIWVLAQVVFFTASIAGYCAPGLLSTPLFWLIVLPLSVCVGLKVAQASTKFSAEYMENKLSLSMCCYKDPTSGRFFPRLEDVKGDTYRELVSQDLTLSLIHI